MKRLVILQPSYLPWIGYFDQINKADVFVFFDDVQFTRRDWRNRNRIKAQQGNAEFLTVPVQSKGNYHAPINQILIDNNQPWEKKHLMALLHNYKRAPFYQEVYERLQRILARKHEFLSELTIELIQDIVDYLGIRHVSFYKSSDFKGVYYDPTDRLIQLCKYHNATHYLTGDAAKNYLDESRFNNNNIVLEYHNYTHPVYPQLWGAFVSHLSIVDLLFNVGHSALQVITPPDSVQYKKDVSYKQ